MSSKVSLIINLPYKVPLFVQLYATMYNKNCTTSMAFSKEYIEEGLKSSDYRQLVIVYDKLLETRENIDKAIKSTLGLIGDNLHQILKTSKVEVR